MVKIVGEVESGAETAEFSTIDISKIKSPKTKRSSKPPFKPLLALAMGIESGHLQSTPSASAPAAQKSKQVQQAPARHTEQEIQVQKAVQQKNVSEVKKEIGSFADTLGGKSNETATSNMSELPIQEQISELNKIIAGVKKNTLDKTQMQIMKMGLHSLDRQLSEQKKPKRKLSKSQQKLIKTRDRRLSEAIELLSDAK